MPFIPIAPESVFGDIMLFLTAGYLFLSQRSAGRHPLFPVHQHESVSTPKPRILFVCISLITASEFASVLTEMLAGLPSRIRKIAKPFDSFPPGSYPAIVPSILFISAPFSFSIIRSKHSITVPDSDTPYVPPQSSPALPPLALSQRCPDSPAIAARWSRRAGRCR